MANPNPATLEPPTDVEEDMMIDAQIRQDVLNELEYDPALRGTHIDVAAEDGVVTLMGTVASFSEKWEAERAAKHVRGVKGLVEHLDVALVDDTKRSDADLAQAALSALRWRADLPPDGIFVTVRDGVVTLEGEVAHLYQRGVATQTVAGLVGVQGVLDDLQVKPLVGPALDASAIRSAIQHALARDARVDALRITTHVDGTQVVLTGRVHAWHEREAAERAAALAPGVTSVVNRILIAD